MPIRTKCARMSMSVAVFVLLAACVNTQQISRYDGRTEYVISCGQAVDWNVCHDEAKKRCPYGYDTLSQDVGFTAKELKVLCNSATNVATTPTEPVASATPVQDQPPVPPRKIFIISEPHSLLIEDMARRLIDAPSLAIVDDRRNADIVLRVEAYNFDFSDSGTDTQHISLPKYLVPNIVGAAFYMPDASSYNLDIQRHRAETAFEFAYTVLAPSGAVVDQKVIRDRIERESAQCSRPTVNNAFGGIQPAQFWASDDLQSECSQSSERPTKSAMQSEAEAKISTEMLHHLLTVSMPEPAQRPRKKTHKKIAP